SLSSTLLSSSLRTQRPPTPTLFPYTTLFRSTETLARESDADMVLNAMVGAVGLAPSLAALQSGKVLALANKESLVVGGELIMDLDRKSTRLNSSHQIISYAVFCLKKKNKYDR